MLCNDNMCRRILGIDYGKRRIGIAVSDPMGVIAQALETIEVRSAAAALVRIKEIVEEQAVSQIVVGRPLTLKGHSGEAVEATAAFVEKLKEAVALPTVMVDERFTSVIARQTMVDAGRSPAKDKGSIDRISAALILQTYLDTRRPS